MIALHKKKLLIVLLLISSALFAQSATTLTGWITNSTTADHINAESRRIQIDLTGYQFVFWATMPMYSGPYEGQIFMPADDVSLYTTNLWRGMTPVEMFNDIFWIMGGLDARQEVDADWILIPEPNTAAMITAFFIITLMRRKRFHSY